VPSDRSPFAAYPRVGELELRWRELAARLGARESIAGLSVEGRPIWRFDIGPARSDRPPVLLTALIHGVEVIGSLALLEVVTRLLDTAAELRERSRFVVMPVLNPDALAANLDRLSRGRPAARRKNANGVDLNRNFPTVGTERPRHPFAGSTLRFSPHYRGPHPLSEPESRAVHDVASELRPSLSLGFHSFGNMLLYPGAIAAAPTPAPPPTSAWPSPSPRPSTRSPTAAARPSTSTPRWATSTTGSTTASAPSPSPSRSAS
jgi:predicted deacylase